MNITVFKQDIKNMQLKRACSMLPIFRLF